VKTDNPLLNLKKMIITNSYLVELNLPTISLGQRYTFLDIPQLRYNSVIIEGIEAFSVDQLAVSPNNKTIVSTAATLNLVLTLVVDETEELYQIPYYTLISSENAGLIREFANKRINLVKSYVTILNTTGLTAAQSVIFNFYYRKMAK
jgi:hypothetical protein